MNWRTYILLFCGKLQQGLSYTRSIIGVVRTTENWWGALAVYFGITRRVNVRFRNTGVSFLLSRENWNDYLCLRRIHLSRRIHYSGHNRFRFLHPKGVEFNWHDSAVNFFGYSSEMDCYYDNENNVVCEVDGLKFITPFPFGAYELNEIFIDKIYGEPRCECVYC